LKQQPVSVHIQTRHYGPKCDQNDATDYQQETVNGSG
jgi:hypothetical protein